MMGNLTLSSGAIKWDNLDGYVTDTIDGAYAAANEAEKIARAIAAGKYEGGSFISNKMIYSPEIYSGTFYVQKGDDKRRMVLNTNGLFMYLDGIDQSKFALTTGQSGKRVTLRLGAGDETSNSIFMAYKDTDKTTLTYTTSNGIECGFVFKDDNTIELKDPSTVLKVPACFG